MATWGDFIGGSSGVWQPGQIVQINLPDRGISGEYMIQKVTIKPVGSLWTYKIDYGGRLLGVADFLRALVAKEQKQRVVDAKYQQKIVLADMPVVIKIEFFVTPRTEPWYCGDEDAICGEIVCLGVA
jgi:hypothetical protein